MVIFLLCRLFRCDFHRSLPPFLFSYHLLLCVLDFVFHNLYLDRRRDLLNSRIPGLPSDFVGRTSSLSSSAYKSGVFATQSTVLETLCDLYGGTPIEAKGVKVKYDVGVDWERWLKQLLPCDNRKVTVHTHTPSPQAHYLLPFLNKMFEKMTLRGKSITYSQVLSSDNFKFNNGEDTNTEPSRSHATIVTSPSRYFIRLF